MTPLSSILVPKDEKSKNLPALNYGELNGTERGRSRINIKKHRQLIHLQSERRPFFVQTQFAETERKVGEKTAAACKPDTCSKEKSTIELTALPVSLFRKSKRVPVRALAACGQKADANISLVFFLGAEK
jgi:hypothetical protein